MLNMATKKRSDRGHQRGDRDRLGVRLLELLRETDVESHLMVSRRGRVDAVPRVEHDRPRTCESWPTSLTRIGDVGAAISSGSFKTMGMIIAPCSMKTLAEIASGVTSNLLDPGGRRRAQGTAAAGAIGA